MIIMVLFGNTMAFSTSTLCKVREKHGLDIQCGLGDSTALLSRRNPDLRILGIEKDAELCQQAKQRYPNLLFFHGDAEDMTFYPDILDIIQVPLHEISSEPFLKKLHRMLHPKGILRILDEEGRILYRIKKHDLRL
jgi:trans-aconitate methyltransferase